MRRAPSGLRAVLTVAHKELRSSFRDRQTAIYTLVLPIVMYPIVFWLMIQGLLVVQGQREQTEVRLGVTSEVARELDPELLAALDPRDPDAPPDAPRYRIVHLATRPGPLDEEGARAWLAEDVPEPLDAVLLLADPDAPSADGAPTRSRLYYDRSKSRAETLRERIERRLPAHARARRTAAAGAREAELVPLDVVQVDIAPLRDRGKLALSMILPLLMVAMTIMGAFFPAVDLTAGEKERGTAETTMLLPIPRLAVQQGKILAVAALAVVATFLNLVAIGFSAEQLFATLASTAEVEIDLPVLALVAVAPLALLFAFFVAAALTGIASLARTFKEGQALLGPVQMVFILPAMIGVIPGIELSVGWALVPVVNVVLAFKALLVGRELYLEYTLTALAQVAYAWLALRVSVRLLSREAVLFARGTIPFRRLLATLRSAGGTD
jgi:ABC-type Na+ efflux pump permease subunit